MFIITIPCYRDITSIKVYSNEGNIPVSCAPVVTPEYCNATETKLSAEVLKKKGAYSAFSAYWIIDVLNMKFILIKRHSCGSR